jgi:hypothetical protein
VTRRAIALIVILSALGTAAFAQDFFRRQRRPRDVEVSGNVPYDGRLVFVRLRYDSGFGGFGFRRGNGPGWAHDYPTADLHMMKIVNEISIVRPRIDGSNVFSLSDPELFKYPIAYMSEPGGWLMEEDEAKALRTYLLKGGFMIFDDFRGSDWDNLVEQVRKALPELTWIQLEASHPVFHSFFEIDDLHYLTSYSEFAPTYWGLFEQNDTSKRLLAIANRDNDLGEYWEFSDTGYAPVDLSNQAYKFGLNYFIYGLTH